jgi:hypothetical protein
VKQQHLQAAVWLLRLVPSTATATAITERLLQLPAISEEWALQLVEAGVRISYAQLLTAAESMLLGVEEWVCAQQYLGVPTDIPAAAVAICCGRPATYQLMVSADITRYVFELSEDAGIMMVVAAGSCMHVLLAAETCSACTST